ncbi:DUF4872 domain-containing protein [Sphaerisporangium aureirubrum]|uniref:DUF4872 domain-containing protein n=1 Tax=Sphaerisporangium aureirubrum TaxID=1544736 RepID=A0ABW1NPS6_9ACTN
MTERKHLKRLVRARMARTGESYSTALRHVAGAREPRPCPAALPGYTRFGGGVHHDSALLAHVLAQAGVVSPATGRPYTEAALAGLGGGIGFMYAVFEYRGHDPMTTLVTQAHPDPMIPKALARAGIPYEASRTSSAARAEATLRATLASGRAAVCRVNRYALPWRPGYPFPDPLEAGVAGIDGDTVLLDDQCAEPHELPIADLMTAWSALPKARHHMIHVTGPGADGDPRRAARDAVAETVAKMTGPVLGNSFDVNFGLSGMRKLRAQLADTKGRQGWSRRFANPRAFFTAMTRLHDCLEIEYGAPGAMRPLYADFLDEAAPLLDGPAASEAAALYREAGRIWSKIASDALPPEFAPYHELITESQELLLTEGARATPRLRELRDGSAALTKEYGDTDPLGPAGRADLLASLADQVAQAVHVEEEALRLLTEGRADV